LGRAIEHVREQLDRHVGDFDLASAINRRDVWIKLEAIDRRADPPKRVSMLLEDEFFRDFRIEPGWGKLLTVALVPNVRLPRDHVLYAWGPDLLRLWPSASSIAIRANPGSASSPGSADAWIDELFPRETWRLHKVKRIHDRFVKEVAKRNKAARKRDPNALEMVAPSLTAVREALKNRLQN
jgi:hypothetical protein